ncbi:S8 family serine peptidase [Roseateles sp. SL47]|uniref:S8 family peptidase n=1 Tax=Roseateles sp. SL47 TaxID=2995138 RepID=UPI00226E173E|nr:S8 family serine peptidase [Roseateles sp. SL47]WAC72314.1 S8 family serine peptidase [Roseateles sp. SL47]
MSLLRRSLLLPALLAAAGLLGAAVSGEQNKLISRKAPSADASSTSARVIVKYRNNASVLSTGRATAQSVGSSTAAGPQLASTMGARLGFTLSDGRPISGNSQVLMASGMSSQVLADKLAADSDVEWAVVDQRRFALGTYTPNDPLYADNQTSTTPVAGQWYLRAPTTSIKSAIDVETAWATTQGSSSVVVAVLDTGIIKAHPDLSSKLVSGYDFISDSTVANDGGGRDSDPSDPGDWVTTAESASGTLQGCDVGDSSWHGTQTASLIGAATNNGVGMAGVAPNVMIMPVRVLGKCGGYDSDIQAGMRWAAGLSGTGVTAPTTPAKVINMSLGSSGSCSVAYQTVVSELTAAGVVVVAAAGNDGLAVGTPANCSGVVGVVGLRHSGTKVGFSDLGSAATIAAPAGNCVNSSGTCVYPIITATNTGTTSPSTNTYSDGSNYAVGTSFSAPLVSGTAALMMSANTSLTPGEVTSLLKSSATAFPGAETGVAACQTPSGTAQTSECYCTTSTCGAGMLNTGAAVNAAVALVAPTPVLTASATTVLPGETITLDASSSTSPSGRAIASYLWQITSGSSYAAFSGGTTSATTTLLASAAGTVTVQLTVTDSAGLSASTTKSFTVAAGKPTASFTASTTTPVVGATVTLDGSASKAATGASITGYLWDITSGTSLASFSGSATAATTTLSATAAGSVVVRLTVTDSNGYTSSSSQTLTVSASSSSSGSDASTTSTSSSSGGGGGAFSALWALGLLALTLLLGRKPRVQR